MPAIEPRSAPSVDTSKLPATIAVPVGKVARVASILEPPKVTVPSALSVTLLAWVSLLFARSDRRLVGSRLVSLLASTSKLNKCPAWLKSIVLVPDTAVIIISPPGAARVPALKTLLPDKLIVCPGLTLKSPKFAKAPFIPEKEKALGSPTKAA